MGCSDKNIIISSSSCSRSSKRAFNSSKSGRRVVLGVAVVAVAVVMAVAIVVTLLVKVVLIAVVSFYSSSAVSDKSNFARSRIKVL